MQRKICKVIFGFFLVMLVFTILSQKLNDISKATVEVASISSGMLDYSIEAQGTVMDSGNIPISTIANQLIENINVNKNQKVVQGEELFSVNKEKLESQKQELEIQIEGLKLQIADAQSARETEEIVHRNTFLQTQENYNSLEQKYNEKITSVQEQIQAENQLPEEDKDNDKIAQLQKECENIIEERDAELKTVQKALTEAAIPLASNSERERLSLELEAIQEKMEELEELSAADGKIYSPFDGIITEVSGKAGEITSEGSVLLMTKSFSGSSAVVPLTEGQRTVVNEGDICRIEGYDENNNIKIVEEAKIVSIQKSSENDNYEMMIDLQGENFLYNSSVNFYMEIKSRPYSCCIPISALRVDSDNNYYVLVVENKETILGEELIAKKINVKVIEKSGTTAAIEDGVLDRSQKIIVNSSKSIEKGSFVKQSERIENEE